METSGTKVKNLFFYLHKNFLVRSKSRWYFGHTEKVWNTYIFDARFWQFKDSNVLYLLTMFEIGLMRELNTILWRCYLLLRNSRYFSIVYLRCLNSLTSTWKSFHHQNASNILISLFLRRSSLCFNLSQWCAIECSSYTFQR